MTKRETLQLILDKAARGWVIKKPPPNDPDDPENLCIFQNLFTYQEAAVEIPTALFDPPDLIEIEARVRSAIRSAR